MKSNWVRGKWEEELGEALFMFKFINDKASFHKVGNCGPIS